MSTQFQSSNFLDVKTFFTNGDIKSIPDLISEYIIKDTVENKVTLTRKLMSIRFLIESSGINTLENTHNGGWDKLQKNKTFFN
jgi:hypothetical protein